MPTYEIEVDGQRRSFLVRMPWDWATYEWGSLPLVLGLHGGGETAEQFYENAQVDLLYSGELTLDERGDPVPQKFISVFPQGLSTYNDLAGEWNSGWTSGNSGITDVDDVKAIVACVEKADELFAAEYTGLTGQSVDPMLPFFGKAGILILGFSNGAAMAYRCGAELPTKETKWGEGALAPTCIAVAENSAGGFQYANNRSWEQRPPLTPLGLEVLLVRWAPPDPSTCSLLHMQSDRDEGSSFVGGASPKTIESVDRNLGLVGADSGTADFYRWDLRPGPVRPNPRPEQPFDPTISALDNQEAIGPWVSRLPGGPESSAVNSITLDEGKPWERYQWDWLALDPGPPWRAVRFVLWSSDSAISRGHYWPHFGFEKWNGTGEAWQFFLDHS